MMRRASLVLVLAACQSFDRAYEERVAMLNDSGTAGGSTAGGGTAGGGTAGGGTAGGGTAGGGPAGGGTAGGGPAGGAAAGGLACQQPYCELDRITVTADMGLTIDCQSPIFTDLFNLRVFCWRSEAAAVVIRSDGGLAATLSTFPSSWPTADGRGDDAWVADDAQFHRIVGTQLTSLGQQCGTTAFVPLSMHSPAPGELWAGSSNGTVCHLHDGGADLYTVPGVTSTVSAIFAFDAGVWIGSGDGDIHRLDGTVELTGPVGSGEVFSLHGLDPDIMYASLRYEGVWQRGADAGWTRAFAPNLKVYHEVRVLGPNDVWASDITIGKPMHKTATGWAQVDPELDLGINTGGNDFFVLGVRGNARELLLTGSVRNPANNSWDGIVVRMLRGP